MKQNKYDQTAFFKKYSKMPRSEEGLSAAEEWSVLRNLLPEFKEKEVLDLGCGYGWHCIYAKEQGAKNVIGIDLSEKMITYAQDNSKGLIIDYRQMAIEEIDFPSEQFDCVISSLALHYVADLAPVFVKINECLKKGGSFVFSMEHPMFTSLPQQDWFVDIHGNRLHWPVDRYQQEGVRETRFLGHEVVKYHRTIATIVNALIETDFEIKQLAEPQLSREMITKYPEMEDETKTRRSVFIIVAAVKK